MDLTVHMHCIRNRWVGLIIKEKQKERPKTKFSHTRTHEKQKIVNQNDCGIQAPPSSFIQKKEIPSRCLLLFYFHILRFNLFVCCPKSK